MVVAPLQSETVATQIANAEIPIKMCIRDRYGIAVMRAGSNSRDALMMSAMLVDVSDEAFQS